MKRNTMKSCSKSLVAAVALSLSGGAALAEGLPVVGNFGGLSNASLGNVPLTGGINSGAASAGALSRGLGPLHGTLNPLLQPLANGARPSGNNAALLAPGQRTLPGLDVVTNSGAQRPATDARDARDAQRRLESTTQQSEFNRASLLGVDLGRLDYDLGSASLVLNQGRGSLSESRIGDALDSGRDAAVGSSERFTQDINRNEGFDGEADGSASGEGSVQGVGNLVGSGTGRVSGQGSSMGSLSGSGSGSGSASGNVIGGHGRAPDVVDSTTPPSTASGLNDDVSGTLPVGNSMPVVPAK